MSGWRAALVATTVGMLVLAIGWLVGRDEGATNSASTTSAPLVTGVTLACPRALELVCRAVGSELTLPVTVLRPGAAPPGEAVVIAANSDLPPELTGPEIGRSPIVLAVWQDRSDVLANSCDAAVDLTCAIERLGQDWEELGGPVGWGRVTLGVADPATSEAGLAGWEALVDAGATAEVVDRGVTTAPADDGALMLEVAQIGKSRVSMVVTTEVAIASQLDNIKRNVGRFAFTYPDPGPWVSYVAAATGGGAEAVIERLLTPEVQSILASSGLRPVDGSTEGLPADFGEPGTPSPTPDVAARDRLLELWGDL